MPADWQVALQPAKDRGLTGRRLHIAGPAAGETRPSGRFIEICARLDGAALAPAVRNRALDIFRRLAEAEAQVHGLALADVGFHEIADWDSVADIVGAALVIESLPQVGWSVAPLPLGSGRVATAHGPLPVPAPATALLLDGLPVLDDGIGGERVTPTGAAIVQSLQPGRRLTGDAGRLLAAGYGFGSRALEGIANTLRVLVLGAAEPAVAGDRVAVIRFEIDDQTPEDLALALGRIAADADVCDVCQWPAYGKKGRLLFCVQVLAAAAAVDRIAALCLAETTTIGLRQRIERRSVLTRRAASLEVAGKSVAVKTVQRPDGRRTAKVEADQLAEAGDHAARARLRAAAEAAALADHHD